MRFLTTIDISILRWFYQQTPEEGWLWYDTDDGLKELYSHRYLTIVERHDVLNVPEVDNFKSSIGPFFHLRLQPLLGLEAEL